ncbi:hypothetical protein KHA80_00465 [Anaerobacillus sp. HL2]|nr:hypothetical protein KHA80_00465 [Anaerobacillus sp. HL2]
MKNSFRQLVKKKFSYTFILRDDMLNEVWLNTNSKKMIEALNILHMLLRVPSLSKIKLLIKLQI